MPRLTATLLEKVLLLLGDAVAVFFCFWLAFWAQFHSGWIVDKHDLSKVFGDYSEAGVVVSLGWLVLFFVFGLYRRWLLESRTYQVFRVVRIISFGLLMVMVALFGVDAISYLFDKEKELSFLYGSRFWLILGYGISLITLVSLMRLITNRLMRLVLGRGYGYDQLLVLGANENGDSIVSQFRNAPELGQKVVGYIDERYSIMNEKVHNGLPVLGKYADLENIIRKQKIKGIIISHQSTSQNEVLRIVRLVAHLQVHVYIVPDLYDVISGHFHANFIHGVELKELFPQHMPAWQVSMKRLMDIVVASALLLLSLPLTLTAALLVKLGDKGPIFYSQERVGLYGKSFWVHKFRTMRTDAEKGGPQWAQKNDDRITPIGKFMRRSRIDEIPQLLCVLKGDMSMVGPRPERQFFIDQLKDEIPLYVTRLKMKPGLTGWAQVRHHYDTDLKSVETKLRYDLYYFENMSLMLDLQILVRTIWVVISGKGAQ